MDRQLFQPFTVEYDGNDADSHLLDAAEAGRSVAGTARLYNSILHFYFIGQIPAPQTRPLVRTYTHAPRAGTVDYVFLVAAVYGQIAAHPEVLHKCGEFLFSKLLALIFARRTGKHSEMMKMLEIIQEQARQNTELAQTAIGAIAKDKEQLLLLMNRLVDCNHKSMAEMVSPVGMSCRTMTHFAHTEMQQVIDEPMAEVMRSKEEMTVGTLTQFDGIILGVDKSTGQCRVKLSGAHAEIRGKITDPILSTPHNIYTMALDNVSEVILTAKPIIRDGAVVKLFISDAKTRA